MTVKEIALRTGLRTFMQSLSRGEGSGMHVLCRCSRRAQRFLPEDDPITCPPWRTASSPGCSRTLVRHACHEPWGEFLQAPWSRVRSAVYMSWARRNRADLIRVPEYQRGKESATRIEYRSPDAACNPYLAFACMLAAGLEGVEKGLTVPEPIEENVYDLTEAERKARGINNLPGSLAEAIDAAEGSELLRRCLGDHLHESLLLNKRIEWAKFRAHVTDWETSRYLAIL